MSLGVRIVRGSPEAAMLQRLQIHNQKHQYIKIGRPNLVSTCISDKSTHQYSKPLKGLYLHKHHGTIHHSRHTES